MFLPPISVSMVSKCMNRPSMSRRLSRCQTSSQRYEVLYLPTAAVGLGIQYCLKKMNDCDGDWLFYRLELFHPNIPQSTSHRVKRRKERQQQRLLADR